MNNNQFKKLIRTKLEALCLKNNMECVYVDVSTTQRMFYLYQVGTYLSVGSIALSLSSTGFRMYSNDSASVPASFTSYCLESHGSYLQFREALVFLNDSIDWVKTRFVARSLQKQREAEEILEKA